jgi:uncharacterized DUF497 family protein
VERQFEHQFEWDPAKALRNAREHRVSFERAATVFLDPRAMSIFDDEHSEDEERWNTLGLDRTGVLLVVCHTFREEKKAGRGASAKIRLISARRADRREAAQYRGLES